MQVAGALNRLAGSKDTVARLGGDEFAIIHHGAADELARKIVAQISKPIFVGAGEANISVSIGISSFAGPAHDYDTLIRRADQALYRSKREGKGTWRTFSHELDGEEVNRAFPKG